MTVWNEQSHFFVRLRNLGRFGKARLEYLHSECFGYYRELLITGKLAEHCEGYDMRGV